METKKEYAKLHERYTDVRIWCLVVVVSDALQISLFSKIKRFFSYHHVKIQVSKMCIYASEPLCFGVLQYSTALLLLQLFKAHMDYVDRTRAPMSADKSSDNNVYATPRRYHTKAKLSISWGFNEIMLMLDSFMFLYCLLSSLCIVHCLTQFVGWQKGHRARKNLLPRDHITWEKVGWLNKNLKY